MLLLSADRVDLGVGDGNQVGLDDVEIVVGGGRLVLLGNDHVASFALLAVDRDAWIGSYHPVPAGLVVGVGDVGERGDGALVRQSASRCDGNCAVHVVCNRRSRRKGSRGGARGEGGNRGVTAVLHPVGTIVGERHDGAGIPARAEVLDRLGTLAVHVERRGGGCVAIGELDVDGNSGLESREVRARHGLRRGGRSGAAGSVEGRADEVGIAGGICDLSYIGHVKLLMLKACRYRR